MRKTIAALLVMGGLTLTGCGAAHTVLELRDMAATDLDCEQDQLEINDDQAMRKTVRGCGRSLTYEWTCDFNNSGYGGNRPDYSDHCRWRARSES